MFAKNIRKMETEHLIPVVEAEKSLGIITASIFLAGEMAGSGVLALPAALKALEK